jgi:sarcosine oxidase
VNRSHCDVIVAGLGAMGSATAMHLAHRGLQVVGVDQHAPPHTHGSSHGESRIIREAYFEGAWYVPLVRRAYELWHDLEEQAGHRLLQTTGALSLGAADGELIQGTLRSASEHRIPYEILNTDEVRRRYPVLQPPEATVGVYEPRAGFLRPEDCIQAHLQAAQERGATLRFGESLRGWRYTAEGVEVVTDRDRLEADALVLAVGAWLTELVPALPLEVERQVMFWFHPRRDPAAFTSDRFPVFLWETTPASLFYGIPDLGHGMKAAQHHCGVRCDVDTVDRDVSEKDEEVVRQFLDRHVPAASGRLLHARTCLYTNTPDQHFLVDQHPASSRVWVVSPCSGHGFKFSSVIGERVAEWVMGGVVPSDLTPFGIGRLQGGAA